MVCPFRITWQLVRVVSALGNGQPSTILGALAIYALAALGGSYTASAI